VTVVFAAVALAACGTPTAEPVFSVAPQLPAIPEVRPLPPRDPPPPIRDTLVLRITPGSIAPDEFDVVNSPGAVRDDEARRPSVVVFGAVGLSTRGRSAVESALLRHGFSVLEQSAVEQRLDEIRDSVEAIPPPPGGMPDMSRVLAAAQSVPSPADYLFQVERLVVEASDDRSLRIGNRPETRAHVEANPGLSVGGDAGQVPSELPSRWYRTEMSARLLDVGTGSIVWLGSHDLESPDAEPDGLEVRIATERVVADVGRINAALAVWNDSATALAANATSVREEIREVYAEGSTSREFDSDEAALAWQRQTIAAADRLERRYRDLVEALSRLTSAPPSEYREPWTFRYVVSPPVVDPDLAPDGLAEQGRSRLIDAHLDRLVRAVAASLVNTIVID
jgi:hypothetical protein